MTRHGTTIRVEGAEDLARALEKLSDEIKDKVGDEVYAAGFAVRTDIQKQMHRGSKSGVIYTRDGITHQASAAGEAPAVDTGRLVGSVNVKRTGPISAEVFSLVEYGVYLEFGTVNIAARPSWVPAVERMRPIFTRRVEAAMGRAMK